MFLMSSQVKKSGQCQLRDKKHQYFSTVSDNNYESYSALSLDTRGARWEEFSREKKNYRQRSVQQQFNNGDFLEQVGAVRD
jgi:arginine utilization protein RocB